MVKVVSGGDNSTYSENTNLDKRVIHIHGGMEHNLDGYAKYYSYGCIEISGSNEFIREADHKRKDFSRHW